MHQVSKKERKSNLGVWPDALLPGLCARKGEGVRCHGGVVLLKKELSCRTSPKFLTDAFYSCRIGCMCVCVCVYRCEFYLS